MESLRQLAALARPLKHDTFKFELRQSVTSRRHIDYLLLHLENVTKVDVHSHALSLNGRLLSVKFAEPLHLAQLPKDHQMYTRVIRPFDQRNFHLDRYKLVLYNVPAEEQAYITVYLKNIAGDSNTIAEYQQSKIFPNSFIVRFNRPVDFDAVASRIAQHGVLTRRQIHILRAYKTNAIIRQYEHTPADADFLEDTQFRPDGTCWKRNCIYEFKVLRMDFKGKRNGVLRSDTLKTFEQCFNIEMLYEHIGVIEEAHLASLLVTDPFQRVVHNVEVKAPRLFAAYMLLVKWMHICWNLWTGFFGSKLEWLCQKIPALNYETRKVNN